MDDDAAQLNTETRFEGSAAVVTVIGELDAATCEVLTNAAHDAVARGAVRLVLDLSSVDFMDSSGISALIAARSIAPITLRQPSAAVEQLIGLTGLTDVLAIEP